MFDVGDVLGGDFRLVEKVGEGGFGAVYRAHQIGVGRTVAVKVLLTENLVDPVEALDNFRAEVAILDELRHPQIPAVYSMGFEGDTPYVAMEWIDGPTLQQKVDRDGPFSEFTALHTIQLLTRPLALAHARGVLHRDLKPGNVQETATGEIKLIDFGLAKSFGITAERARRRPTDHGEIKGTVWFLSPEQARGETVDARADVYSIGALLYFLLTGKEPFVDRFVEQGAPLVLAIGRGDRPLELRQHRRVTDAVADLVSRLMAFDPDMRPESMPAAEHEVNAVLQQPQLRVTAKTIEKTIERMPALAMPVPAIPRRTPPSQPNARAAPTPEVPSRRRARPIIIAVGGVLALGGAAAWIATSARRVPRTDAVPTVAQPVTPLDASLVSAPPSVTSPSPPPSVPATTVKASPARPHTTASHHPKKPTRVPNEPAPAKSDPSVNMPTDKDGLADFPKEPQ